MTVFLTILGMVIGGATNQFMFVVVGGVVGGVIGFLIGYVLSFRKKQD